MMLAAACTSDSDTPSSSSNAGPRVTAAPATSTTTATTTTSPDTTSPETTAPETTTSATTTAAAAAPLSEPTVRLVQVGDFEQPVEVTARPLDGRVFVVDQPGRVVAFDDESDEVVLDVTDLTSADGEQGLLGLAFHPEQPLAYINYINSDGNTVVAEYAIDPDTAVFDPASWREVLTIGQPFKNHNGGELLFGPDGLLYIGTGDGGSGGDPNRASLDLASPLGKLLRIDPLQSGTDPFSVPADNPFVGVAGADEAIWSYGLRNPWRFSFDAVTGDLWIADVGQDDTEEIDVAYAVDGLNAAKGMSFGWSAFEGHDRYNEDQPADGHEPPFFTYAREGDRCSVTGGVLYRGESIPDLAGWYVFGDFCSGEIWALDPSSTLDNPRVIDIAQQSNLAAIAQGPERELFAVSINGTVSRFTP